MAFVLDGQDDQQVAEDSCRCVAHSCWAELCELSTEVWACVWAFWAGLWACVRAFWAGLWACVRMRKWIWILAVIVLYFCRLRIINWSDGVLKAPGGGIQTPPRPSISSALNESLVATPEEPSDTTDLLAELEF